MIEVERLLQRVHAQQVAFSDARALYGERFAPEFSPFHFIDTDELGLSRIIAWMLTPAASHGQGARFLSALVETFGLPWDQTSCETADVRIEVPTSGDDDAGRIDILIQSGGRAIAIENKPSANDQPKQISRYLAYLDRRFPKSRCLIYLPGNGRPPSDDSITAAEASVRRAAGELHLSSYAALVPWIVACRTASRADRVAAFLDEFRLYIERRFLGVRDVTERDRIVAEMTRSADAILASFQVVQQAEAMKVALLGKLETQLRDLAQPRGWTVTPRPSKGNKGSGYLIVFPEWDDLAFVFGFADEQRSEVSYGVLITQDTHAEYERIHAAIAGMLGRGEKWGPKWPWGRRTNLQDEHLPINSDWGSSGPWRMIVEPSQPMATAIIRAAEKVQKALAKWDRRRRVSNQIEAPDQAMHSVLHSKATVAGTNPA